MYVAFSAASNVTGILTDTVAVAELCHKYGALSFWDYATAGPYLNIDMNPTQNGWEIVHFNKHVIQWLTSTKTQFWPITKSKKHFATAANRHRKTVFLNFLLWIVLTIESVMHMQWGILEVHGILNLSRKATNHKTPSQTNLSLKISLPRKPQMAVSILTEALVIFAIMWKPFMCN